MINTSNVQRFHFKKFTGATKQELILLETASVLQKAQDQYAMHGNGWESCLVLLLMNVLGGRFLQLGNWHALIATQEKKKPVINCTRNSGRLDAYLLFYHKHAWLFHYLQLDQARSPIKRLRSLRSSSRGIGDPHWKRKQTACSADRFSTCLGLFSLT